MRYTQRQKTLAQRAKEINGQIESTRWDLAYLAFEAEAEQVENWAEIIGAACRRSPSTVYEWRRAEALRNSANGSMRLSISFWVTAANGLTEDNAAERMAWIQQCEADPTITLESARANLPRKPKEEPPMPSLKDTLMQIDAALDDAEAHPEASLTVAALLREAHHFLDEAFDEAVNKHQPAPARPVAAKPVAAQAEGG